MNFRLLLVAVGLLSLAMVPSAYAASPAATYTVNLWVYAYHWPFGPIANVPITVTGDLYSQTLNTDSQGKAIFRNVPAPPGWTTSATYTVTGNDNGDIQTKTVSVGRWPPAQRVNLWFSTIQVRTLTVHVVDVISRTPISNIVVDVASTRYHSAQYTDGNGVTIWPNMFPTEYQVTAKDYRYLPSAQPVRYLPSQAVTVDLSSGNGSVTIEMQPAT